MEFKGGHAGEGRGGEGVPTFEFFHDVGKREWGHYFDGTVLFIMLKIIPLESNFLVDCAPVDL
jgi:hypothetical protein